MKNLVTQGAVLQCSMGVAPSVLQVTPEKRVNGNKLPMGTVSDCIPMKNIQPFGMCQSLANPQVQAATAAALGTLTPQPCIPVIVGTWAPGSLKVKIMGQPALTKQSKCTCSWAGVITIK